jgi:hypothetical protein
MELLVQAHGCREGIGLNGITLLTDAKAIDAILRTDVSSLLTLDSEIRFIQRILAGMALPEGF